jgi:hypothetical protein
LSLYRPERLAEPFHGKPKHRQDVVDVYVRLAKGFEDDLLSAIATGDKDRTGVGSGEFVA